MSEDRELLKQVLDELNGNVDTSVDDLIKLCDRLRTRLEKPDPEPVAWMYEISDTDAPGGWSKVADRYEPIANENVRNTVPLYQRKD